MLGSNGREGFSATARWAALAGLGATVALALPGCGAADGASDKSLETHEEPSVGQVSAAISGGTTLNVPIYFHFLYDHIDAATGLPSYGNETILDVDSTIAWGNGVLDTAAGSDARRLHIVRAGVEYEKAPGTCPDPQTAIAPHRVYGAINTIMTNLCSGVTTSSYSNRANAGALIHELGHALGLFHTFEGNTDASTVELLYRDRDPNSATSCYRRGDHICDTPPDYGYVGYNSCATQVSGENLCLQDGPPCNPSDPIIDGTGVCTNLAAGLAQRAYDPAKLGLFPSPAPGNMMAYWTDSFFTQEQFLRMHNYVDWRIGLPDWVSAADRAVEFTFWGGPADPIWAKATNRDWSLSNAVVDTFASAAPGALPINYTVNKALGQGRRVLGVKVTANVSGTPSGNLKITVTPPRGGSPAVVTSSAIRVANGQMFADEAYAPPPAASTLAALRGIRSQGAWSVRVEDSAPIKVTNLTLQLVETDRGYETNDRGPRGVSDVIAYRASANQLWVSANQMNGGANFAGGVFDKPGTVPAGRQIIAGDVDGDGGIDLVARNGSAISVAFNRDSYATWYSGGIAGSDTPLASDEVLMGDFDGDGFGDLMRRRPDASINSAHWKFHRGVGDGTFEAGVAPVIGANDTAYATNMHWTVGDLNGDGRSDLLIRYNGSGLFWASVNVTAPPTTNGVTPTFYGGFNPTIAGSNYAYQDNDRLILMDVNQDGLDDLVVRRSGTGEWITSLNQSGTAFGGGFSMQIGGSRFAYNDTDTILGALN
ncbi:MAG TPA: hypothetical protein VGI39_46465 [Polyangiaceae bacterium]